MKGDGIVSEHRSHKTKNERESSKKPELVRTGFRQTDFSFDPDRAGVKVWNAPEGYSAAAYFNRLYFVDGRWIHHEGPRQGPATFANELMDSEALRWFCDLRMDRPQELEECARQPATISPLMRETIKSIWEKTFAGDKRQECSKTAADKEQSALEIIPGGIKYGAATVELGGKTLACIREFCDAFQQRLDWETLRNRVWDAYTDKGTIKNAVKDARDALRKLARQAGMQVDKDYDPLPCVNHGKDLAWKLSFPE